MDSDQVEGRRIAFDWVYIYTQVLNLDVARDLEDQFPAR